MITRGIREFVARDWRAVRESKDAYWADRVRRLGPAEAVRISEELRRQALLQDSDWPTEEARRADLESHVRLVALLRRASPTCRP